MLNSLARLGFLLLPLLLLIPEVLEIGGTFVRWDYLLLPVGALLLYRRVTFERGLETRLNYTTPTFWLFGLLALFTGYQLLQVDPLNADVSDAVKYALWPVKIFVWAAMVRELVLVLDQPQETLHKLFARLAVLVFLVQLAELASPAFRDLLNTYFPTAAKERLSSLDYRARGVFNGYDTASLFFCLCAIVCDQTAKALGIRARVKHCLLMLLCLAGSVLSARTGFLLLTVYVGIEAWRACSAMVRIIALLAIATLVLAMVTFGSVLTGEEGTLGGRYLEIFNFVSSGDPTAVNSFWGTLYMNYSLFLTNEWSPLWGNGLDTQTTADQLYAKYLFMFGLFGTGMWVTFHAALIGVLARVRSQFRPLAVAGVVYLLLMAVAHVKGGNYLFAQRLGELTMLVLMLALSRAPQVAADTASEKVSS